MQDPDLCQEMLQRILPDLEIDPIEYPEPQKRINPDMDARGIRLDIYVRGSDGAAYVIEMQMADTKELGRFLDYVDGRKTEDPYIDKLDGAVKKAKRNREWRREYMTLYMRDLENIEQGIEQEKTETIRRMLKMGISDLEMMAQAAGLSIDEAAAIKDGEYAGC